MNKYTHITGSMKRDVRLAKYNVTQLSVQLTAKVTTDRLEEAYKELFEDLDFILQEEETIERERYRNKKQNNLKVSVQAERRNDCY